MMMKSYIKLNNARFYSYHGVNPQETIVGNEYYINLSILTNLEKACLSDNVEDTINYASVYEIMREEMAIPSKLLEHVAMRIVSRMKKAFHEIEQVEISISKRNPPMSGDLDSAEVVLSL